MQMTDEDRQNALLTDIRFFMAALWLAIGSDNEQGTGVAPLTEIELEMAEYLANGPRRRVTLGTRGIGKTYIECGVICYKWNRDPNRKILAISKSQEAVNKTSTLLKHWLDTVPFLQHLKPRKGKRDSLTSFDVGGSNTGRQPSLFILGIGGQVDNNRGHTIWCDDVETLKNSMTLQSRQELRRACGNLAFCQFPDIPPDRGGPADGIETVYTLTPKHEETLAKDLMEEGFDVRAYPLCVPAPDEKNFPLAPAVQDAIKAGRFRKSDGCLLPHRFTEEDVEVLKAKRHLYLRECQLVMTLGESERYPLKLKDFIVFDMNNDTAPVFLSWGTRTGDGSTDCDGGMLGEVQKPNIRSIGFGDDRFYCPVMIDKTWAPYQGTKMRIDQAGKGADKTGFAVVSHLNGFLFIRRLGALRGGANEQNMARLALTARETNTTTITVESNFGGDAYANLLQVQCNRLKVEKGTDPTLPNGWACNVETKHSTGQKELRIIDAIEGPLGNHRLVVSPAVASNVDFQRQLTRITRESGCLDEDDLIDALAGCLFDWGFTARIDPARSQKDTDEEKIARFVKEFEGKSRKSVNWSHQTITR